MKTLIIQKSLSHYRVPFFELLKKRLNESGIYLDLIYGQQDSESALKGDAKDINWGVKIDNRIFSFGSRSIYWQPCLKYLCDADLIIVEQASKLLLNYILMLKQIAGTKKLAFWGHGKNMQELTASGLGEFVKRLMSRKVHWWFAYNDLSASFIQELGYPSERITSVQNAIDTKQLVKHRSQVTEKDIQKAKTELGLKGKNVCVFAGGMYAEKRLDFLIESCAHLRRMIPDFEIIFIGSGPEFGIVEEFAGQHDWVKAVGPKFDSDKVRHFAISHLLLIPGAVGLAILDSFALEVPMVTTRDSNHGPEIDYLEDGQNGLILEGRSTPSEYAASVADILSNDEKRKKLIEGCRKSKDKYTIEAMVERFAVGVEKAFRLDK